MPNISYACPKNATTAEKAACSKKKSAKAEHQAGCKDKSCNKCKHGKGCGGNCKHNSCRCGASVTSLTIPTPIDLKAKYPFAAVKKQKFGFKEAYYSSGYYSIWLPPKISYTYGLIAIGVPFQKQLSAFELPLFVSFIQNFNQERGANTSFLKK